MAAPPPQTNTHMTVVAPPPMPMPMMPMMGGPAMPCPMCGAPGPGVMVYSLNVLGIILGILLLSVCVGWYILCCMDGPSACHEPKVRCGRCGGIRMGAPGIV